MNTQLAKQNGNTALAVPEDYIPVAGIEKLSPDDFSIPVVKLVQTNTGIDNADQFACVKFSACWLLIAFSCALLMAYTLHCHHAA